MSKTFQTLRGWLGDPPAAVPAPPSAPGETAWGFGRFFGQVPMERWNPDSLVAQRGYRLYRKMMSDDQIRALVRLKTAMVTGRAWHFDTPADSPLHQECAGFFRHLLEDQLAGSFIQALGQMLSSQVYGFSLTEKVYGQVEWRGQTLWGIQSLKLRPAESFTFQADPHGNCTGLLQYQGSTRAELDLARFIHHVNQPDVDPLYGESDLKACYRHWWAKENILAFWNLYLERMASGFIHGRITAPLTPEEREELKAAMQGVSGQTSLITPAGVELSMVSAPSTDAFERAVAARDKAMAKALLVPNLLGLSEQGSQGSYSQSQTHQDIFFLIMNALADTLAETLNEQLFKELAWWNFGLAQPPRFRFSPHTEEQKRELVRAWTDAVRAGAVKPEPQDETRIRELLGVPLPPAIPLEQP
ncbi:MAG: DUF935 domain-containing protein [Deltaproteobacteria bacterium]|nr:DUF935 domain-containing protein [Deltaproteobacteria bacterium]